MIAIGLLFVRMLGDRFRSPWSLRYCCYRRTCVGLKAANLGKEKIMNDWLHNLPTLWMTLLLFGFTYLVTAAIYALVALFAVAERAKSFKAVSPGLLSPLGVLFGLFVAFTAAQVWADNEKARAEIDREAS